MSDYNPQLDLCQVNGKVAPTPDFGQTNGAAAHCSEGTIRSVLRCSSPKCDCYRPNSNVHCPAHRDSNPSLSVHTKNGTVLVKCHAGCSQTEVIESLKSQGLWPSCQQHRTTSNPTERTQGKQSETTNYNYCDVQGGLLFQVQRTTLPDGKKKFSQRRPDGSGGWIYDVKGVALTLYGCQQILHADVIYVVEGEKCADALNAALRAANCDAVATTNPMGAGKWRESYTELLNGKQIVVLPDNDTPGRKHAEQVCSSLQGAVESLRVVELPELSHKEDIADWLAMGRTVEELQELVEAAQEWTAATSTHAIDTSGSTPRAFKLTDYGNAERLIYQHGADIRYCHDMKKWLVWEGQRWSVDATNQVERWAKETVRSIYCEASNPAGETERRSLADHAKRSESASSIKRMLELAKSEPTVKLTSEALDRHLLLLNCSNGTLNFETGELQPHHRDDLITKLVPVDYDPDAGCRNFTRFLIRVMGGNRRLIRFLQRAIGYSLTGDTREQVFFIFHGAGANGKSTLLDVLSGLLKDYAQQMPAETLMAKKFASGASNDVARLRGARLVSAMETDEGRALAMPLIKQMTGGDAISARFLYGEYFDFKAEFKLFLTTNHKPEIPQNSEAVWRRIKLIPFSVTIPEDERDTTLPAKLHQELPGILAWAVRGCLEWQAKGLGVPDEVKEATNIYRTEMDDFANFISDCCERDPKAVVKIGELYSRYQTWCLSNKETPVGLKVFAPRLTEHGFHKLPRKNTGWYYQGLRLREKPE